MQYRTRLLGGTIEYTSSEKGTSVVIVIPQTSENDEN